MTQLVTSDSITPQTQEVRLVTYVDQGVSHAPFVSDWGRFANCSIIAQVSGSATGITASIERADLDPANYPENAAPADSAGFTGDPSSGMVPKLYSETGTGWWRWNISAISGGSVTISLAGSRYT
jgi:hypothetical protein